MKTSAVWKYFVKSEDNEIVTCNLCNKNLKFHGNTTNLRDHIRRRHPFEILDTPLRQEMTSRNDSMENEGQTSFNLNCETDFSINMTSQSVTQVALSWDNYHNSMGSGLKSLLDSQEMADVIFSVEGKFLKAHKVILSVCSSYFKELFRTCLPFQQPIVFMNETSYSTMNAILTFMYQGEVSVEQDELTSFIKTAEALQIKGIWQDNDDVPEAKVTVNEKIVGKAKKQFKEELIQTKVNSENSPTVSSPAKERESFDIEIDTKRRKLRNKAPSLPSDPLAETNASNISLASMFTDTQLDTEDSQHELNESVEIEPIPVPDSSDSLEDTTDSNIGLDGTLDVGRGTVHFRKGQKRPIMVLGQYEFKVERQTTSSRLSWCCVGKERYKCKSRLVTFKDNVILKCREHNHKPTFKGDCIVESKSVTISYNPLLNT